MASGIRVWRHVAVGQNIGYTVLKISCIVLVVTCQEGCGSKRKVQRDVGWNGGLQLWRLNRLSLFRFIEEWFECGLQNYGGHRSIRRQNCFPSAEELRTRWHKFKVKGEKCIGDRRGTFIPHGGW